jgi:hypothetical protein
LELQERFELPHSSLQNRVLSQLELLELLNDVIQGPRGEDVEVSLIHPAGETEA